jgi:type 1 fimbria pilin
MMRANWLWVMLLVLLPLGARAECRYDSGSNTPVIFSLPSTITIAANTPNGTVIATSAQATPANPPVITCGYWANFFGYRYWQERTETLTYGVVNSRGGNVDNTTYATGIPGLSYRITHPDDYLKRYPLETESISNSTFSVTSGLELVKTGPIASGSVLAAGNLGDWQWTDSSGNTLKPETFRLGNSITFTTPSCTIVTNPIYVTLPTVTTSAFGGIGSTSGKTPFQIQLNCPAGTAVSSITMHTSNPDSHTGVVAPSGAGYAAGIGVRILDSNSNPMQFETQTVVTPPNATTSIPYFAQYFQTAPAVTGGSVKATVTFDLVYQ